MAGICEDDGDSVSVQGIKACYRDNEVDTGKVLEAECQRADIRDRLQTGKDWD